MLPPDRGPHELYSLQILRGLAAVAVMLVHLPVFIEAKLGLTGFLPATLVGAAGVDVFFVISGFIMVYASGALFGASDAPLTFLVRRIVRIVPLYWTISGLMLGYIIWVRADFAQADLSWSAIWTSFLFIPYPRPSGQLLPLLNVGWTLNYEMFFYLVFAATLPLRRSAAVFAVASFFLALAVIGRVATGPEWVGFITDPIILEFCFGMIIALAYVGGTPVPRWGALTLIVASCAAFLASNQWGGRPSWRVLEWGVPAAMLVAGSLWFARGTTAGLVRGAFTRLGDASYSLYLLHTPVMLAAPRIILRFVDPASAPWLCILAMVAAPIAVALAVHALFERPVTRWLQGMIGRRNGKAPRDATAMQSPRLRV